MDFQDFTMPIPKPVCLKEIADEIEETQKCSFVKGNKDCPAMVLVGKAKVGEFVFAAKEELNFSGCLKERR